ncbi:MULTISPECIES: mycofactocin biosynthesis chaperone MftB [unclassified Rhodococcus (in: high G+C Gram-positive bacteria)]|uniref:mycofactocin biosynthesis chaperone MftB n=1 Tax=unclassified Rhodococcus (in: high G+C Gram-positive bacteria) TaxID=192944 RepID=UPI000B9B9296|nr:MULTISPECIES: mycofactocin biosynthesis chaperone MftB [unclassified Rhodococcus (in: high G+C Gram-positive bacteria)]OZE38757.1 mycofactocin biosynthesis chaperone MftB [Rhodococcus sp. 05-2254-4]OZE46398.1 mycofactocin biosynthesis chaperone MftB [Rhodococcus sp. 05-2254-3]OZE54199.1 mycofactocin biosynthesis chaperone MftB [Rhodococcus sp. 05-2254-2]
MTTAVREDLDELDLDVRWILHPQVALRPESFGALLYHFGTRKLSFLKNRTIVAIIESLPDHPDMRSAIAAAGITESQSVPYVTALATLARSNMITRP